MDGFEINKIAAAVLLAGLTAVGASLTVNGLYGGEEGHHGHEPTRGYRIEGVETAEAGEAKEEKTSPDIALFFANATVERGAALSKACLACHGFEQGSPHKVGPKLWDVVQAPKARHVDYSYSNALASLGGNWDYQSLSEFLEKPAKYVKGTKMAYAGMKKPEDRASIILYLRSLSDNPKPLPEVTAPVEEEAENTEPTAEQTPETTSSSGKAEKTAAEPATTTEQPEKTSHTESATE